MIFLDTDFLVELGLEGDRVVEAVEEWRAKGETLATTSVNAGELLRGAQGSLHDAELARDLLARLEEVPLGPLEARRFGILMDGLDRAGKPMPEMDGLIAACALEHGARLATLNPRHFKRVPGLELVL